MQRGNLTRYADGSELVRVVAVVALTQLIDTRRMCDVVVAEAAVDYRRTVRADQLRCNNVHTEMHSTSHIVSL